MLTAVMELSCSGVAMWECVRLGEGRGGPTEAIRFFPPLRPATFFPHLWVEAEWQHFLCIDGEGQQAHSPPRVVKAVATPLLPRPNVVNTRLGWERTTVLTHDSARQTLSIPDNVTSVELDNVISVELDNMTSDNVIGV